MTATAREAEDLTAALSSLLPPDIGGLLPGLGDAAARAAVAPLRHLGPAAGRAAPAGPPRPGRPADRAAAGRGRAGAQPAAADGRRAWATWCRSAWRPARRPTWRRSSAAWSRSATPGPSWSRSAASIAVRGGILDVFPPTEEHPLRVDFFGDEVEEIRYFKVADQRSLEVADDGLWAPPCRELLLTPGVRARAKELAAEWPGLGEVLSKLADGITVEGMEAFAPTLSDRMELLLDYVPAGGIVVACDPERIRARAADLVATSQEFLEASWVNAAAGGQVPIDLGGAAFRAITDVRASAADLDIPWWTITPFAAAAARTRTRRRLGAGRRADEGEPAIVPDQRRAGRGLPRRYRRGCSATCAGGCRSSGGSCWSPRATGRPSGWPSCCAARAWACTDPGGDLAARARAGPGQRGDGAAGGRASSGRRCGWPCWPRPTWPGSARAPGRTRRMPSRRRGGIDPLQLTPGDYIVHEQHGVGRYVEMTSRTVQGATRDYLVIEYAPSKRGQPAGPAVPAHRPARRGDPVLRRRGAGAAPAGRRRLGQGQGPGPQGGARHRGRA